MIGFGSSQSSDHVALNAIFGRNEGENRHLLAI
jgi:hypothetical protein